MIGDFLPKEMMEIHETSMMIRMLLAMFLGGLIGSEREKSKRPAGFRTHILVCIGACMTALIGLSVFREMGIQKTLKALSDPIRRDILNMLKSGKMSAGDIVDNFDVTGAAISRHLSVLKEADLIRDKREGKFIFYEINTSVLEDIMIFIKNLKGDNNNDQQE